MNKQELEEIQAAVEDEKGIGADLADALLAAYLELQEHMNSSAPFIFPNITRVTVVADEGIVFEKYNLYKPGQGIEIHQQDSGRTLKIFPRS